MGGRWRRALGRVRRDIDPAVIEKLLALRGLIPHGTGDGRKLISAARGLRERRCGHTGCFGGLCAGRAGIMCGQVFFRYVLNSSLQWSEEASIWAMVWMVFVGSVVVMRELGPHLYPNRGAAFSHTRPRLADHARRGLRWRFFCRSGLLRLASVVAPSNAFSHNIGVVDGLGQASVPVGLC